MPLTAPVTLEEVKQHCRIDFDEDDELLCSYITAAREWVEGFLNIQLITDEGNSAPEVKQSWKQAILLLVGHWYANRENTSTWASLKEIPFGVKDLLWLDRNVPI